MIKIKTYFGLVVMLVVCGLTSCAVSYKFNGSSVDYSKIKTIYIADFPNQAPLVYPSLASDFTESLKDEMTSKTRLSYVSSGGDMQIEGAIVGYSISSMSVSTSGEAMDSKLMMSVRVKFTNKVNPEENFETTFSAYQVFSNVNTINQVQDELNKLLIEDIVNQIFNKTVANW